MKETYESMSRILNLIKYRDFAWKIVADFKVLTILFGMQGGYTATPCFLCLWKSRTDNREKYEIRDWPPRSSFVLNQHNVKNIPLVEPSQVILPPLHLKLGFIKQFVKKLDPNGEAFKALSELLPRLSAAKIKEGKIQSLPSLLKFTLLVKLNFGLV